MKKKILSILITVLSLCTCIFTLTACGENEPPHTHEYTTLKYDAISHWYECTCGDKYGSEDHKGGTATETNKATCSVCNQEYGETLGHVHALHLTKVDATIQSCTQTGNIEYFTCSCGKWFTTNTATTEITDKESVVIAKDDHEYKELKKSATEHWYECICGDKYGIENHEGGTATCQVKATCSVCGTVYGNLAEHSPKQDWIKTETHHYHECVYGCTEKLNYGEHDFDKKKCNDCDYVTTTLLGTEISSEIYQINGTNLSVKVPNEQTNFSFAKTINVAKGATYKVYTDISCKSTYCIPSYAVNNLTVGNNTYYFLVSNGTEIPQVYTVKIRRRPMYTVTFNTDGGTSVSNQVIEEDSLATEPITTKTGYDFVSWNYDFNTPITDNITITAEWNIKQYTLTIVYDNGQENLVLTQDYNTQIQTIESPKKLGYSFAGWNNVIPTTMPAEDRIITATWDINQYTLKIVYDNGQEDLILTQDYNTPIQPISNPVRDGYAFTGWNKVIPSTMPAENLTITATWEANKYTPYKVEYYLQNLADDDYTKTQTVDKTGTTDCVVTAEILSFDHFTPTTQLVSEKINGNGKTILKVYYTRNTYKISCNNTSNCSITNLGTYKYGDTINLVVTLNLGYEFLGWFNGEALISKEQNYNLIVDKSLVAKVGLRQEMKNFNFVATSTTCTIMGMKDKTVTEITIPDYVTSIDSSAFYDCSSLTKVNYTGTIDQWANIEFSNYFANPLSYAKNLYINDTLVTDVILTTATKISEYAFFYCSSITSVVIPDSVTSIGDMAFAYNSSLKNVKIPNSVTNIGSGAFCYCNSLISIEIPNSVASIGASAFKACYNLQYYLEGNLKYLGNNTNPYVYLADTASDSIASAIINSKCIFIGSYALENCSSLTSVEIPNSVTSIGYGAFSGCSSLTSVAIPNSVTSINWDAFKNCSSLVGVTIGNGVTSIGNYAFSGCSSLTKVNYLGSIDEWVQIEFGHHTSNPTYYVKDLYINGVLQTAITINAEKISDYAFYNCSSLTSVIVGDKVTSIGGYAFYGCRSLTSVAFNDTLTWYITTNYTDWKNKKGGTSIDVKTPTTNDDYLSSTYLNYYWYKI